MVLYFVFIVRNSNDVSYDSKVVCGLYRHDTDCFQQVETNSTV
jgi:hypothetical protein